MAKARLAAAAGSNGTLRAPPNLVVALVVAGVVLIASATVAFRGSLLNVSLHACNCPTSAGVGQTAADQYTDGQAQATPAGDAAAVPAAGADPAAAAAATAATAAAAADPVAADPAAAAAAAAAAGTDPAAASEAAAAAETADPAAAAAWDSGGYGGALPLVPPTRYTLPAECRKHTVLYGSIYADLAAFMSAKPQGITEEDLLACPDIPYGTKKGEKAGKVAEGDIRRLLLHNNKLYSLEHPWPHVASGSDQKDLISGQHYWQFKSIMEVAEKWGLPDLEFVMARSDAGFVNGPGPNGTLCPGISTAKSRKQFDLLIPEGQFVEYQMDEWVREEDPFPWEDKEDKAVARFTYFCPYWGSMPPSERVDRWGNEIKCPREHNLALAQRSTDTLDVDCANCPNMTDGHQYSYIKLSDQRRWKYALDTDGWGPALRFYKLLGGGWTILKDYSPEHLWFFPALQPWVHYIPVRWNGPDEVNHVIRWLRQNDHVARSVARNAKQFARSHLNDEGRLCYIKVLFEELAGLYRFKKKPGDYGRAVLVEEELSKFRMPSKTTV